MACAVGAHVPPKEACARRNGRGCTRKGYARAEDRASIGNGCQLATARFRFMTPWSDCCPRLLRMAGRQLAANVDVTMTSTLLAVSLPANSPRCLRMSLGRTFHNQDVIGVGIPGAVSRSRRAEASPLDSRPRAYLQSSSAWLLSRTVLAAKFRKTRTRKGMNRVSVTRRLTGIGGGSNSRSTRSNSPDATFSAT